jgi:hypothetical protein
MASIDDQADRQNKTKSDRVFIEKPSRGKTAKV